MTSFLVFALLMLLRLFNLSLSRAPPNRLFDALLLSCRQRCLTECSGVDCSSHCGLVESLQFREACWDSAAGEVVPKCWASCNGLLQHPDMFSELPPCERELNYEVVELTGHRATVNITWPSSLVWDDSRTKVRLRQGNVVVVEEIAENPQHHVIPNIATGVQYEAEVCHGISDSNFTDSEQLARYRWNYVDPLVFTVAKPSNACSCAMELDYDTLYSEVHHHNFHTVAPPPGNPLVQISWKLAEPLAPADSLWVRYALLGPATNVSDVIGDATDMLLPSPDAHVRKLAKTAKKLTIESFKPGLLYGIQVCAFHEHILPLDALWSGKRVFPIVPDEHIVKLEVTRSGQEAILRLVLAVVLAIFLISVCFSVTCHCVNATDGEPIHALKVALTDRLKHFMGKINFGALRTATAGTVTEPGLTR